MKDSNDRCNVSKKHKSKEARYNESIKSSQSKICNIKLRYVKVQIVIKLTNYAL